ncbi:MAG: EAL domain-containing protein [Hyphomonadaceae bacterium]
MFSRFQLRDYFWLIAGLGLGAIALLIFSLFEFAHQADIAAKEREEAVVTAGLVSRAHEVGRQIIPNAIWDDAVRNLDNNFSSAWAHDNIGQFSTLTAGYDFAFVLAGDGTPRYAMEQGEDREPSRYSAIDPAARNLVAEVREAEARRRSAPVTSNLGDPIQATAVKLIGSRFYIVTATLVQSDFGAARILGPRGPIVITGREIDDAFMAEFGERYMLDDAHIHEGDARGELTGDAHAAVRDETGAVVATVDWTPQGPGAALLARALPWIIGLMLLMLTAALLLYRRAQDAAMNLVESEERALHMAYHDAMTGIHNRAHLERRLLASLTGVQRSRSTFAVHCIDLDRFKELNDVYGHQVGDELLKHVARRLSEVCGGDGECARLGGDEFAVIQPGASAGDAEALAQRIVDALGAPFQLSVGVKQLSCSIGVAVASEAALEPLELLRQADLALYRAKGAGRGRACLFEHGMDAELRARRFLQDDLRAAIANHDLSMVYQPQVDRSGRIVGVESLVRWNHPVLGAVSPAVFVPLAEEAGLIAELGEFTIRQAFSDSARWPGLRVAINVSATQIQTPGFGAHVIRMADELNVDPADIEIELTEGVLLADDDLTRATLADLRNAGFSLALDDFGTGYSSLSYLRSFPITKIKIDRSFVANLGVDQEADAVVGAIIKLAQALDLAVIAEGVETNEQWLRLMAAGCMEIQGFVASHPVQASAMADMLDGEAADVPCAPPGGAPRALQVS